MSEIGDRPGAAAQPEDRSLGPDAHGARWLRRHLAGAVSVVTTTVADGYRGATVTSCTYVSADPLLLLVAIDQESQMADWIEAAGCFAVSVLPWRGQLVADQFSGFAPLVSRTFTGLDHVVGESGCPILLASTAWAECKLSESLVLGDHRCLVGAATAIGRGRGDVENPLLHYLGRYRRFS